MRTLARILIVSFALGAVMFSGPDTPDAYASSPALPDLTTADELVLHVGESRSWPARGVERVSIEDSTILGFSISEDGQTMTLEALAPGVTAVTIRIAGEDLPLYARVDLER